MATQPPEPQQPDPNWNPQVAPQQGQPVQYVVTQQSLRGVGGWLLFFAVLFGLSTIGYLGLFANALDGQTASGNKAVILIMAPLLAIAFLASVVMIGLQKKLAVIVTLVAIGLSALYTVVTALVDADSGKMGSIVIGIIVALIVHGLLGLYFMQSRRVKETLIK